MAIFNLHSKNSIKNTKELFKKLSITNKTLSKKEKEKIDKEGYLIINEDKTIKYNLKKIKNIIDKLIFREGELGGWEGKEKYYKKNKLFEQGTNRLGNLIEKNKIFLKLITIPKILAAAHHVTKGNIKVCGLNYREPLKGEGSQNIHMDWKPRKKKNERFAGIVCMIYLDKIDKLNGSTSLIPKTHKKMDWPEKFIDISRQQKNQIRPRLKAASIIIINLNLWHAGNKNLNGKRRRMIMLNIKNRNLPQLLNYKKYLSANTKKKLSEEEKYLLSVRKIDPTQNSSSIGVGKYYKKAFTKTNQL